MIERFLRHKGLILSALFGAIMGSGAGAVLILGYVSGRAPAPYNPNVEKGSTTAQSTEDSDQGDISHPQVDGLRREFEASIRRIEKEISLLNLRQNNAAETTPAHRLVNTTIDSSELKEVEANEGSVSVSSAPQTLSEVLNHEDSDDAWRASAEKELHDLIFSYRNQTVHPISVECRSTLCRIEIMAGEKAAFENLIIELSARINWLAYTQSKIISEAKGQTAMEIYLVREGSVYSN